MRIWVDADACPIVIKQILFRAAERVQLRLTLVANQQMKTPRSEYIDSVRVPSGFDVADRWILEQAEVGDLVITADIPLADGVVKKGAEALNPRGELYTEENIGEAIAVRNLMSELRDSGMETGGPAAFGKSDQQAFANQLDRWLARQVSR